MVRVGKRACISYGACLQCRMFLYTTIALFVPVPLAQDCPHEEYNETAGSIEIADGETVFRDIRPNHTHRYFHQNYNMSLIKAEPKVRKLLINLEPCYGTVYLFIRKAQRCWPDPYSCIANTTTGVMDYRLCEYTHFVSQMDGRRDGMPTFFEIPLTSTKFYISVYAPGTETATYTLTLLADVGAFPRPGPKGAAEADIGRIVARQTSELTGMIEWKEPYYQPEGITNNKIYWIYTVMLGDNDTHAVEDGAFLSPTRILNTVCGLKNNTDRHYDVVSPSQCIDGQCVLTIHGIQPDKRYAVNIVAESQRGYMVAYAGLVMRTDWQVSDQLTDDKTLRTVGAVSGGCLALLVLVYAILLKLYG